MVTFEEWVVPIFTKAAPPMSAWCAVAWRCRSRRHHDGTLATVSPVAVAVVGCGPLGLSAVQGARIAGASTIIAIDPISARRDLAMKVGATHVLDPNVEGNDLVERVRALTTGPPPLVVGGRDSGGRRAAPARTSWSKRAGPTWCGRSSNRARPDRHPADAAGLPDVRAGGHSSRPGSCAERSHCRRSCSRSAASRTTAVRPAARIRCATFRDSCRCSTAGNTTPRRSSRGGVAGGHAGRVRRGRLSDDDHGDHDCVDGGPWSLVLRSWSVLGPWSVLWSGGP